MVVNPTFHKLRRASLEKDAGIYARMPIFENVLSRMVTQPGATSTPAGPRPRQRFDHRRSRCGYLPGRLLFSSLLDLAHENLVRNAFATFEEQEPDKVQAAATNVTAACCSPQNSGQVGMASKISKRIL